MKHLSECRTAYQATRDHATIEGSSRTTITKEETDRYAYERMFPKGHGWNPCEIIAGKPAQANLSITKI